MFLVNRRPDTDPTKTITQKPILNVWWLSRGEHKNNIPYSNYRAYFTEREGWPHCIKIYRQLISKLSSFFLVTWFLSNLCLTLQTMPICFNVFWTLCSLNLWTEPGIPRVPIIDNMCPKNFTSIHSFIHVPICPGHITIFLYVIFTKQWSIKISFLMPSGMTIHE